jgi:signal transduction histidine kinase
VEESQKLDGSILVIDDELGMREGCRRALTPRGLRVSTAENGAEGLHKLREGSFDLVLLDAMMPGMGGLELLDYVREHDPDLICVMITGYATVDLAAQAMKQGAYDFLPKPFTSDELVAVVQRGFDEHRRRRALRQAGEREEKARQLKRARQEVAKLDSIESRFMLVVVHELCNPAGAIKNYLQLMRSGYVDEDEWDEYLAKLDLRAGQLLDMLDDLLELAHLKQTLSPPRLQPVDTAEVLEELACQLRPVAEAKGLGFEVEVRTRPTVPAQPGHLRSLWTNLIGDAIRYTPRGQVSVTLSEQDGQMMSWVADTGIGISTEDLTRIFQEFYRSEEAKAEVELGTGLGLPIANQIVKVYQGTIEVDSVPGQGSKFSVRLPSAGTREMR